MTQGGLRERKALQTREALLRAAFRSFDEVGYEATTLEGVCAEAQVSVRTFFRYFESKADLVLEPNRVAAARLLEAVNASTAKDLFDTLTEQYARVSRDLEHDSTARRRLDLLLSDQQLLARLLSLDLDVETSISRRLRSSAPQKSDPLPYDLAAATIVSGVRHVIVGHLTGRSKCSNLAAETGRVVRLAESALAAWTSQSPQPRGKRQ
ncbi:MAG: hypothetical protein B7C54_11645 [Acidimicrobiales bacterium mtb01]|nr:TetR/AcrR family transcriptional regulator [Actinomycetota bacterium]TEX45700.1 MAG: hypothetical protein B7C54_11645 [Acidimicrobiales bacterium mtb01]